MNIFNTYVSLPEGKWKDPTTSDILRDILKGAIYGGERHPSEKTNVFVNC